MKMKKILLTAITLLCVSVAMAQTSPVPVGYKLTQAEDYKKYEKDILKTIDYLENTPINTQKENRLKAKDFLLEWITGSPDVTLVMSSNILVFTDRNPELLVAFMGGYTRYAIQHPEDKETVKGNMAGLKSVIKVYKMGNGMKDDDKVNKLVKTDAKGDLEKWVKEQLAKDAKK
jgi:hypothetical protein